MKNLPAPLVAHAYAYRYVGCIKENGPKATYKGCVEPVDPAKSGVHPSFQGQDWTRFEFLASNDESALAYIEGTYKPGDTRPVQSLNKVSQCRKGLYPWPQTAIARTTPVETGT